MESLCEHVTVVAVMGFDVILTQMEPRGVF